MNLFNLTAESIGKMDKVFLEECLEAYPRSERKASAVLYGLMEVLYVKGVLTVQGTCEMMSEWETKGYPEQIIDYVAGLGYTIEKGMLVRVLPKVDFSIFRPAVLEAMRKSIVAFSDVNSKLYQSAIAYLRTPIDKAVVASYVTALEYIGKNSAKASVTEFDIVDMIEHDDYASMRKVAADILSYFGYRFDHLGAIEKQLSSENV